MRSNIFKAVTIIVLVTILKLVGQSNNSLGSYTNSSLILKKSKYVFRSMAEKEKKVYKTYLKLYFNMNDKTYPKEMLKKDKEEFVEILKGKIINN